MESRGRRNKKQMKIEMKKRGCRSTPSFYIMLLTNSLFAVFQSFDSKRKLVGTACWLIATSDSTQSGNNLVGIHAFYETRNATGVAHASTNKRDIMNFVVVVDRNIDELATCALSRITDVLHTCNYSASSAGFMFV